MTAFKIRSAVFEVRARRGLHIVRRVIEKALDDNVFGLSAQLAFYFLLALFPFLLLVTTLLAYVAPADALDSMARFLEPVMPGSVYGLLMENLQNLLTRKRHGLLSFSAVTLLWSASSAFLSIMQGLNVAYDVSESRPIWKARLMAILLTIALGLMGVISTSMLTFGQLLNRLAAQYMPISVTFWVVLRWTVALLFSMLTLDIVYYSAPNVRHPWRWFSPGALLATPAWVAMSIGYSLYISRFGRYEATYGALAAIITLMLWFYFSGVVLLVGGELNSILERKVFKEAELLGMPLPAASTDRETLARP